MRIAKIEATGGAAAAYVAGSQKHKGHIPALTRNAMPKMPAPASNNARSSVRIAGIRAARSAMLSVPETP